jgi:hypothetical protein
MPRDITDGFRNEAQAQRTSEVFLYFVTIYASTLAQPVRVVSEMGSISYANGLPINYKRSGLLYSAIPFDVEILTDTERPPRAVARMANIDRVPGEVVLRLRTSPRIKLEILALSDFGDDVDEDNARVPTGTPVIEYSADFLRFANVRGDAVAIEAELRSFDLSQEPWPSVRATAERLPGLFR